MISNEVMNGTLMEKGKVKANLDLGLLMNLHFVRLLQLPKKSQDAREEDSYTNGLMADTTLFWSQRREVCIYIYICTERERRYMPRI